mgnify:CR=1 FL=1
MQVMDNHEIILRSSTFRAENKDKWLEFEQLLKRVEKYGMRSLSEEEVMRLSKLYNHTISSLAVARSISLDAALLDYLHNLSKKGYFCIYTQRDNGLKVLKELFVYEIPRAIRAQKYFISANNRTGHPITFKFVARNVFKRLSGPKHMNLPSLIR